MTSFDKTQSLWLLVCALTHASRATAVCGAHDSISLLDQLDDEGSLASQVDGPNKNLDNDCNFGVDTN